jgi:hypothetical protein
MKITPEVVRPDNSTESEESLSGLTVESVILLGESRIVWLLRDPCPSTAGGKHQTGLTPARLACHDKTSIERLQADIRATKPKEDFRA